MREIKAIETEYNGYKFRSRLEARWAVFFDEAKIIYEYEPEGFEDQSGVRYLPDFYLPGYDIYVEVKPNRKNDREELERAIGIMADAGKLLLILREIPYYEKCQTWWFPIFYKHPVSQMTEGVRITFGTTYEYGDDNRCGGANGLYIIRDWIVGMEQRVLLWNAEYDPINDLAVPQDDDFSTRYATDTEFLRKCYAKARQARFGRRSTEEKE